MPIIDAATVKTYLGITASTWDTQIAQYIPDVDAIIKDYTKNSFNHPFVASITNSSAIITVQTYEETVFLHTTEIQDFNWYRTSTKIGDYFKVGDYVTGTGIATGAYIQSIDEVNAKMTLSGNCTATNTAADLVQGFNRMYNRIAAQMVWYFVSSTNTSVNSNIGIKSKSIGDVSITFDNTAINAKYGVPEALLAGLPKGIVAR